MELPYIDGVEQVEKQSLDSLDLQMPPYYNIHFKNNDIT